MTIHCGLRPSSGRLSYYIDVEKRTADLRITDVGNDEISKIPSMFEEIKCAIKGEEFGCLCICLYASYGNEIRKKFVEEGLKAGFKIVEIINWHTAFYLHLMSQIPFKPKNGDVIWINSGVGFNVWQINGNKSKFVCTLEADEMESFVDDSKLKPDVVLTPYKIDEIKISEKSEKCKFFIYDETIHGNEGSLIKARITANCDSEFENLNTKNLLSQDVVIKYGGKEIKTLSDETELPVINVQKLSKDPKNNVLEIISEDTVTQSFEVPDFETIFFTLKIDENEIYFVTFNDGKFQSINV